MADLGVRTVYLTFPDPETAARLARTLLEERLLACANIFPAGRSLYRWEGELRDEPETVVIAKTRAERLEPLVRRVRELHPYEVPCVVALPALGGDSEYLAWVVAETS